MSELTDHEPYLEPATGRLSCFKEGCDWTEPKGGAEVVASWKKHLTEARE